MRPLQIILKRDHAVVVIMLASVIVVAWGYILSGAGMGMPAFDMASVDTAVAVTAAGTSSVTEIPVRMQAMATPSGWGPDYFILMFFMWWIMMIAMMLPSAAPMVLLHSAVARKAAEKRGYPRPTWSTAAFTGGYLAAWAGFSLVAVFLQALFERAGLLSPTMLNTTSALFSAAILLFAGVYQLTPIKQACLRQCRGPIQFLTRHWRAGTLGAFRMGLDHGAYCLGCCWGLMALLFFGGVMNLYWIIGLAAIVLLEKVMPLGRQLSLVTGVLFLACGAVYLHAALA